MAKGSYISENLTKAQLEAMLLLNELELEIFSLDDVKKVLGDTSESVNEIIENLVHKKVLARIERGKYCTANFRDEKAIGCFLLPDGVIAYWSALNLHGLTEQFPNTVFIQTQHAKKDKTIFGIPYKFVKIKKSKRVGVEFQGFGSYKYRRTDKEKTIVDCFDLPQYCGGYPELIRAYCQTNIDQNKLIQYCRATANLAVIKRLAFLSELYQKPKMTRFLKYALGEVNSRHVLMDPFGEETGLFNSKWKLRLNITEEELLEICTKHY